MILIFIAILFSFILGLYSMGYSVFEKSKTHNLINSQWIEKPKDEK